MLLVTKSNWLSEDVYDTTVGAHQHTQTEGFLDRLVGGNPWLLKQQANTDS